MKKQHSLYDVFVAAFVKCHGSIKEMEKYLGVSYPTIKNRLRKLSELLDFVEVDFKETKSELNDVLDKIESGDLNPEQALEQLK